jgi:hypothetical protein
MEGREMIEILKQGDQLIDEFNHDYDLKFSRNYSVIYFWRSGLYALYDTNNEEHYDLLLKRLDQIVRIDKKIDSEYFPIWTKEDGIITQSDKLVRLKGKYYTIVFLEKLIDRIIEFKKISI